MNEKRLWEGAQLQRMITYPVVKSTSKHKAIVKDLQEKGYSRTILEDTTILKTIRDETEKLLKTEHAYDLAPPHFKCIRHPLLQCPTIIDLVTDDLMIGIATEYLGCAPALGTLNLRRSFITDAVEDNTLLFHSDPNSIKFLKFFFYFNDVDIDGGPLTIVEGSIKDVGDRRGYLNGFESKYRWSYDEVVSKYGEDKIKYLTAKFGEVLIADTNSMHRGTKVKSKERTMLTLNYVVHKEEWNKTEKIYAEDAWHVPSNKQYILDFLEKI